MEYNFREIEKKWQQKWKESNAYKVSNDSSKPKCYVLDMFPYPSGAGLHVGHPLGYIASDIYARYKRNKGFNVLHPMGFDSFGLPAEQYALDTGQHPAVTTEKNIATFKAQLDKIGFCYDWSREVRTSDPSYYKWTQWIFLQLFNSYFCNTQQKARPIADLIKKYETKGSKHFTADEWNNFSEKEKSDWLMKRRLAYSSYGEVNWCEALGTVLANDEVVNGVSERGGHPVIKKKMRQWYLRITAYADRLLQGLETVEFSDAMKEMQRNWIGKSEGANLKFKVESSKFKVDELEVYTTRPDTIFGVDFMVLAPEHQLVPQITTDEQSTEIEKYLEYVKSRSERERLAEVKQITGAFTGAYAINPFNGKNIPIWISEYVLAGYGTGAIMAVPCGDQRDFLFAKHFNIPITNIIGEHFKGEEANPTKEASLQNSGFMNGMLMKDAIGVATERIEELGIGTRKKNYKMRDAGFSRQRYWGEPFPIIWKDDVPYPLNENELPLELPHVDKYSPGPEGEGPLANIEEWVYPDLTPSASPREGGTENPDLIKTSAKETGRVPGYFNSSVEEWKKTSNFSKENRKNSTHAEDKLWQQLRNRNIENVKFRRQHPMHGFIPDFVCLEKNLIIEIDGGYHTEDDQKIFDAAREEYLKEHQLNFLRFTNEEVENNIDAVIATIISKIKVLPSVIVSNDPNSPLRGRGAGGEVNLQTGSDANTQARRETSTMPGYAGSSWYFLRYMDPHNTETFCDKNVSDYWNQVDVYVGGTEHAVGHLLYSRMWTKFLFDRGWISYDEPYKKLVNQGMIQGSSRFVYRIAGTNQFVSHGQKEGYDTQQLHVDVNIVDGVQLDIEAFKKWKPEFENAEFIFENGNFSMACNNGGENIYITGTEVEKMSKSKFNTVNPDDLVEKYGADTFRMYEMFLGPVEASKPWDTKGIEGVHRFLRKLWRLFYSEKMVNGNQVYEKLWTEEPATKEQLKVLHRTIKKINGDNENFSYNTAVSAFMVCVNELTDLKTNSVEVLEPLLVLLSPYAPHISQELFSTIKQSENELIIDAAFPLLNENLLVESNKEYPISINGKVRSQIILPLDADQSEVEEKVLANDVVRKWLDGKPVKKVIYVKNKMVNVVV